MNGRLNTEIIKEQSLSTVEAQDPQSGDGVFPHALDRDTRDLGLNTEVPETVLTENDVVEEEVPETVPTENDVVVEEEVESGKPQDTGRIGDPKDGKDWFREIQNSEDYQDGVSM